MRISARHIVLAVLFGAAFLNTTGLALGTQTAPIAPNELPAVSGAPATTVASATLERPIEQRWVDTDVAKPKPKEDKPKQDKPKQDKPREEKPKQDKPKQDKPKQDKPREEKPKHCHTERYKCGERDESFDGNSATRVGFPVFCTKTVCD